MRLRKRQSTRWMPTIYAFCQSAGYTPKGVDVRSYQCARLLCGFVADDHGHADDGDRNHEEAQTEQNEELQFPTFEREQMNRHYHLSCGLFTE